MLKAALMWTINDIPAYEMLSGWMMQGKLACPIYMENRKAFTWKFRGKNSWFTCHRRFLDSDHPYRCNRYGFTKNSIQEEESSVRLNGH